MIKYNSNNINDWNFGDDNIIKVYRHNAICYYKIVSSGGTSGQTPCFAVVNDISQYSDTEFEDVFNNADGKWYKLNNLNQYEEYGVYGSGRTITYYEGKLTIDDETIPSPSRLPSGYTEVEYIRQNSNYNAYINTNVLLFDNDTNSYTVTTRLASEFHSNLGCATIISAEVPASPYYGMGYRYKCSSTVDQLEFFGGGSNYASSVVDNGDGTRTVTFQSTGNTSWTSSAPLSLLCSFSDTSFTTPFRYSDATIYSSTIVKNGITVRDFVPAKRDSDSKYGLYDLVTDTFYVSPNGNNFIGGSAVTPPATTATCEFIYSGNSWVNLGEVSGSTATLPDVPFTVNYNAKNYDASTQTFAKTEGQLADTNVTISGGTLTAHDGYVTVASGSRGVISGYDSYFNRTNSTPNLTIISKQRTEGNNCHMFANRNSNYNWMYRPYSNKLTLHGGGEQGQVAVTTQPVIESVRIDSNRLATYNNYTDNTTSTRSAFSYGSTNGSVALFAGYVTNTSEWFVGDFYWIFMSQTTLTDEQVQQVIDYNEGGGGQPEYPMYYDEMQDPPNNLSFSSMTEAEAYECPWVGMNATIDGTKYIFSGDSQSGYEWVYVPSRLPAGYTEVEYIENTGTSYINTNIQVYSSTTNSFEVEAKLIAAKHDSQSYQNVFSCMSEDGEPYQGFVYRYQSSSLVGTSIPNGQNTFTIVNNEDSTQTVTVTSSSSQRTYTHTYPLTLFCGLNSSRNPFRWTNSKFYYCKIKMNNELVRDFVPAKRDSDSKYGLYDLITDEFYVSPNGNNFIGGNPV